MRRFRGRTARGSALHRPLRRIERLESRSVLNGGPMMNVQMGPMLMKGDIHDDLVKEQSGYSDSFSDGHQMSQPASSMFSNPKEEAVGGFGFSPSTNLGFSSGYGGGGYGGMEMLGFSSYGTLTEVIVIFSSASDNMPAMNTPSAIPQALSVAPATSHIDFPPVADSKPNISVPLDVPHSTPTPLFGQTQVIVTAHTAPLDLTAITASHSNLSGANNATTATMKSALFSSIASATHSLSILDGAAAFTQTFVGNDASQWLAAAASAAGQTLTQTVPVAGGHQTVRLADALAHLHIDAAVTMPVNQAVLGSIPLNLKGIGQALDTVMSELDSLGTEVTHWLDDMHLTPVVTVIGTAALGAGAAYYVHRRREEAASRRDEEEASSSWLFARLHNHSD